MTASNAWREEFRTLMCDLADHRLSPEDAAKLRERLAADPAARRQYVDFMMMLSNLYWIWGARDGNQHGRIGHKLEEVDGGGHAINNYPQSQALRHPLRMPSLSTIFLRFSTARRCRTCLQRWSWRLPSLPHIVGYGGRSREGASSSLRRADARR